METAPEGQRRELWGQMREEMRKLPEEAREALFEDRRKEWEARENKQMQEFFSKPRAEQLAQIDKQIDEQEKRRIERDRRRAMGQTDGQGDGVMDRAAAVVEDPVAVADPAAAEVGEVEAQPTRRRGWNAPRVISTKRRPTAAHSDPSIGG